MKIDKVPDGAVFQRDFNYGQFVLRDLMSDVSEASCSARWLAGLEYILWDTSERLFYEDGPPCVRFSEYKEALAFIRKLAHDLGGWVVWIGRDDIPALGFERSGNYFIPMPKWLEMAKKEKEQYEAFRSNLSA